MKIGRLLVVLTTLLLALATPGGVQAGGATAETLHFTSPNNFVLPSPCTGDLIAFTGEVDSVVHVTIDASGQIHVVTSNYVANTIGIDLTTGQTFRNVGAITSEENLESSGNRIEFTLTLGINFVGPGPGNNLIQQETIHITVNENGEVTSNVDNLSIDCR